MSHDYCPVHDFVIKNLEELKHFSDLKDSRLEVRMDQIDERFNHLERKVDNIEISIPDAVTKNVVSYFDSEIAKITKNFVKWVFRAVIGGGIITAVGFFIKKLLE